MRTCVDCGGPLALFKQGHALERCAACASARENRTSVGRMQSGARRLAVSCWCERTTVWVPIEMIRDGYTASCGEQNCRRAA